MASRAKSLGRAVPLDIVAPWAQNPLSKLMNIPKPAVPPKPSAAVLADARALLDAVGKVPFAYRQLLEFSSTFDPSDDVTAEAFQQAIASRRAEDFTRLYAACGLAKQLPGSWVLAEGTSLFTNLELMLETALDLDGGLREPVLSAIGSGRLNLEREANLLLLLWLERERDGVTEPDEELLKAQRRSALNVRRHDSTGIAAIFMEIVSLVSDDPEIMRLLGHEDGASPAHHAQALRFFRSNVTSPIDWRKLVPQSIAAASLSDGKTITRVGPQIGRNDLCHCGSGKKYKKCCASNDSSADSYAVGDLQVAELKANPELALSEQSISDFRPYELFQFDPHKLVPGILEKVVLRLALFHETQRAREMLDAVSQRQLDENFWFELEMDFGEARDIESLRWLCDRLKPYHEPLVSTRVLLAEPDERLRMLLEQARRAQEMKLAGSMGARVVFYECAETAAAVDPALGLIVARGVIPMVEWMHYEGIEEMINRCRIELGLTGEDAGIEWMHEDEEDLDRDVEHRLELEQQRAKAEERIKKRKREADLLKTRLKALQGELEKREKVVGDQDVAKPSTASTAGDDIEADVRELRDRARMLKGNLKEEHEAHARDREALRSAEQELRRLKAKQTESGGAPAEKDNEESQLGDAVEPRHTARLPAYSDAFQRALDKFDNRIVANAIVLAGKLAAADPHAWDGVRKLRGRPDILRQKVGRSHRLMFRSGSDSFEIVDLIDRRDLDAWVSKG